MVNWTISKLTSNLTDNINLVYGLHHVLTVCGGKPAASSIAPRSRGLAVTYNNQFFQKSFSLWTLCTFIVLAIVSLQGPNPYSLPLQKVWKSSVYRFQYR